MARIEGKIAAILDASTIVVNIGSEDGVAVGDPVFLYEDIVVRDPDTAHELGRMERLWGSVTVVELHERFSVARTRTVSGVSFTVSDATSSVLDFFNAPTGYYGRLPVDDDEIAKANYKIRVGGRVYVEKTSAEGTEEITGNDQGDTAGGRSEEGGG